MADNCKDCANCAKTKAVPDPIPFIAHESAMARMERIIRRLWVAVLVLIVALQATNGAWVYYESQFEDVETTITQENKDGYNSFIGNDGDIYNGEANNKDETPSP